MFNGLWRARFVQGVVTGWVSVRQLLRSMSLWSRLKGINLEAAWEELHLLSRGSFDLVIRVANGARQVAIEAKTWNLDALARLPDAARLRAISDLVQQAARHTAELKYVIYAFSRAPSTEAGRAVLVEIQAALAGAGVSHVSVGVREFLIHLEQALGL